MIFKFGKRKCLYRIRYGKVEVKCKTGDDDIVSTTIKQKHVGIKGNSFANVKEKR